MLDQDTRRRIDTCRDILVGKVPDPKSQVEQITIALIYKFMDDMDNEAVEMGGKASFFTGEFSKYSWTAIFDPRVGGHDLLKLYGEAIEKMNQNPNIPQLFRNIFNNAYLPYRDPETLKLFLKEIDGFHYSHSEKLGDAFEYLLSYMGTQGDAGQFRTPRHIIDFIAEVVDPKKNETVLDPACGTAGFMISAYKHILKNNDGGKELTPDERKRLINNFIGYDISPDMVRLSLVNLYLHGFQDPKIFEYDTLTSEERWDETVDVMLANPPFMTPKGGIRPHKRFAIQANRSELLFVDYIAEHLNPGGRAGIIVPEGIIFQSSNAYKNLRKMLVEDYLWAVVSLPAGVFQPYSGVKTSILLLDKRKSKKSDTILFVKIDNDGFALGAQRGAIDKNDLPEALKILESGNADNTEIAHWVEKDKIKESGDWNLSGERYKDNIQLRLSDYDEVSLIEIADIVMGQSPSGTSYNEIGEGVCLINGPVEFGKQYPKKVKYTTEPTRFAQDGDILITIRATLGLMNWADDKYCIGRGVSAIRPNSNSKVTKEFLWHIIKESVSNLKARMQGAIIKGIKKEDLHNLKIPLPPLSVQEEIAAEIDGYQKIIDGARQVVENFKPTIKIDPDWEMVKLEDLLSNEKYSIKAGPFGSSLKKEFYVKEGYKIYGQEQVIKGDFSYGDYYIDEQKYQELKNCRIKTNDILISLVGTIGKVVIVPKNFEKGIINPRLIKITLDADKMIPLFFKYYFKSDKILSQIKQNAGGGTMPVLNGRILKSLVFVIPPLSIQKEIVTQLEAEQEMVNANKKLIEIYEQKIKDKIGEVWGE